MTNFFSKRCAAGQEKVRKSIKDENFFLQLHLWANMSDYTSSLEKSQTRLNSNVFNSLSDLANWLTLKSPPPKKIRINGNKTKVVIGKVSHGGVEKFDKFSF